MGRLLLLLPHSTYRAGPFVQAARAINAELVVGSNHAPTIPTSRFIELRFADPVGSLSKIMSAARSEHFDAVFGTDEASSYLAALAATALGLKGNPPEAITVLNDKLAFRRWLETTNLLCPDYAEVDAYSRAPPENGYPWVIKPRTLSGSRGVIRVDDSEGYREATRLVFALLGRSEPDRCSEEHAVSIIAERYLRGIEVAMEAIIVDGTVHVIALFDKPDTPAGPTFAETLYVTPSRLSPRLQTRCRACIQTMVDQLGLTRGPLHAELRINGDGIWLIDAAARPIGGQCAAILQLADGTSYETVLLRQALELPLHTLERETGAVGVMMLPVRRYGTFLGMDGLDDAKRTRWVKEVLITVTAGTPVRPLPYGEPYLGFVFARALHVEQVENALRTATELLVPNIVPDFESRAGV